MKMLLGDSDNLIPIVVFCITLDSQGKKSYLENKEWNYGNTLF